MDTILYQLEWKTRRNQPISRDNEQLLRRHFARLANRKRWSILLLSVSGPQVTVIVQADVRTSAHLAQHWLKRSAVKPLGRQKEFRSLPSVWTRKYTARTLESIPIAMDNTRMSGLFLGEHDAQP